MSGPGPTLRWGVVGLGRAATSMLPSLAADPRVLLVAAATRRPEARAKFTELFGGKTFETAEELCASPDVDVVYVATPHALHAEHAMLAARHGKHALVEKPMALTLHDCDRMIEAAERGGTVLMIGPTHGYDLPILKMREIVRDGAIGRVRMILTFDYTNFLYRPRRPEELETRLGGGVIFNQVPHQVDIVRLLGGGLVRSVRSVTGVWDRARPTEGSHMTLLEFEDGAAATMVYSGYDRFDSDELHGWIGEGGDRKADDGHGRAMREARTVRTPDEEAARKAATGFGGASQKRPVRADASGERHSPHFGVMIVSCERGDLRTAPDGILVYDEDGRHQVPVAAGKAVPDKGPAIDELHAAVAGDRAALHDGRWGKATLEVCLAILESARSRREVPLSHQVAARDNDGTVAVGVGVRG